MPDIYTSVDGGKLNDDFRLGLPEHPHITKTGFDQIGAGVRPIRLCHGSDGDTENVAALGASGENDGVKRALGAGEAFGITGAVVTGDDQECPALAFDQRRLNGGFRGGLFDRWDRRDWRDWRDWRNHRNRSGFDNRNRHRRNGGLGLIHIARGGKKGSVVFLDRPFLSRRDLRLNFGRLNCFIRHRFVSRRDAQRIKVGVAADIISLEPTPDRAVLVGDSGYSVIGKGLIRGDKRYTVSQKRGDLNADGQAASAKNQRQTDGSKKPDFLSRNRFIPQGGRFSSRTLRKNRPPTLNNSERRREISRCECLIFRVPDDIVARQKT
jgi:hypothetical protein